MFAKFSSFKAQWCGRRVGPGIIEGCSVAKCRFVKINPAIDSCIAKISFALEYCVFESVGSVKYLCMKVSRHLKYGLAEARPLNFSEIKRCTSDKTAFVKVSGWPKNGSCCV